MSTMINVFGDLGEVIVKTTLDMPLSKREFELLVRKELLVQGVDGSWHLTHEGQRVLSKVPSLKRPGRRTKSTHGPMTQAQRQREYRQRKDDRMRLARRQPGKASRVGLLAELSELMKSGNHPALIHQVLDEIRDRFPLQASAPAAPEKSHRRRTK